MTTLVGIKTNSGNIEAVVLGSDTQIGFYDSENKPYGKKPMFKIANGDFWAIAYTGAVTDELRRFYNKLTNPERFKDFDKEKLKDMIIKSLQKKRFLEIDELNADYLRKGGELEDMHEFLIATNEPQIALYRIDPFGNLISPEKEKNYIILGSGKNIVEEYIEDKLEGETLDTGNIDLEASLILCRRALRRAQTRDLFSGGPMDFVVVRKEGIFSYGRRIKKTLENADREEFEKIIKEQTSSELILKESEIDSY